MDAIEKKIKDAAANALDDSKAGMITSKEEEEDNIDLEMGAKRVYANDGKSVSVLFCYILIINIFAFHLTYFKK